MAPRSRPGDSDSPGAKAPVLGILDSSRAGARRSALMRAKLHVSQSCGHVLWIGTRQHAGSSSVGALITDY